MRSTFFARLFVLTAVLIVSMSSTSHAAVASIAELKPLAHDCRVAVISDAVPAGSVEFLFEAPHVGLGHGGETFSFNAGPFDILAMADGKWLGIEWRQAGVLIAKAIAVSADPLPDERVLLVMNPQNEQDQVHLSCSRRKPAPIEVPEKLF
jgi:hypothetical protein